MTNHEDDLKKLIEKLNIDTESNDSHRKKLRQEMISVFEKNNTGTYRHRMGRNIMTSRIAKLAVAAGIIIAVVVVLQRDMIISPAVYMTEFY